MKFTIENIRNYYKDPRYTTMIDVGLFILLIFCFHFLYLGWQSVGFWPIGRPIAALSSWAAQLLYDQSCWVLEHIFRVDITTIAQSRGIYALDHTGAYANVTVIDDCASLKQWMHWLFLMLLFPGPWKHKAWYIPLGLVIVEWVNVVRVVGLLLVQIPWPGSFHVAHDYVFKTFFYFMIFMMWVIWVEFFVHPKKKRKKNTEES